MDAKNLTREPPRRWSETLDGIVWLPRLVDKARAAVAGSLGDYLFGQSPIDRGMLGALAMSHREFAELVAAAPDDRAVLAALAARSPDNLAAARDWSDNFRRTWGFMIPVLDLDDGYAQGPWRILKVPTNALAWVVANGIKALRPSRAAEGIKPPNG